MVVECKVSRVGEHDCFQVEPLHVSAARDPLCECVGDVDSDKDRARSAKERGHKAPSVRCLLAVEPAADWLVCLPSPGSALAFAVAAPANWQLGNALATRFTGRQVRRLELLQRGRTAARSDFRAGPEWPRRLGGQGVVEHAAVNQTSRTPAASENLQRHQTRGHRCCSSISSRLLALISTRGTRPATLGSPTCWSRATSRR